MKKLLFPFVFVGLLAYACGGGTENQTDPQEAFYKECLKNMEATHSDTYTPEVRDEYCQCAAATYMETFSDNDRALMGYGMSPEQTAKYEAALAPCRDNLEGEVATDPDDVAEPTE